ncbi:MAG TPA: DUF4244 domain-containing protein [Actinocrinis sp.]|uniref:DUF4244 domain-containing protein n=1 Tax=Actinocrinis sp. TaxID=1920516 RepID=UPI002DDD2A94|nr:DUF4244 domain-containing protein [Actinocrinis sp.]HEV2342518.1 DUF4244 domain-containing protein [Actinocrinis sp.]
MLTLPTLTDLYGVMLRCHRRLISGTLSRHGPQAGTTTAEYAIGTLAACGFAALLYKIVTSGMVASLLSGIVRKALGAVG